MSGEIIKKIKMKIESLIVKEYYKEAIELLEKLIEKIADDVELYSMYSVALSMIKDYEKAINICIKGLDIEPYNFDLNYNLGCLYENIENYSKAKTYFHLALNECSNEELKENINIILNNDIYKDYNIQNKIVFFVKKGMDSFLSNIVNELSKEYVVKKVIVENFKQIDKWMEWSDICWFEWCDELIEYGSKLSISNIKKIICRIHRYEVFTDNIYNVEWNNIDSLIVVTEHLKRIIEVKIPDIKLKVDIKVIENGVNINAFKLKERENGFNLAYIGYIHQRKNPSLLLQVTDKLVKVDKRYKLHIAGEFQDELIKLYWDYQVKKMNLEENIIFYGWQDNIQEWLYDKNYILSSSIHESFGYGIAEAMSLGVKPIIHDFVFSEEIWDSKYIWNTIDESINMIISKEYNSIEYREFIEKNYSLEKQINKINELIKNIINIKKSNNYKEDNFNYKEYWNNRYESGGTSGSGSYGKLAEFKAEVINKLIKENNINKVIEFGCGDGNQLKLINYNEYIGLDISKEAINKCNEIFKDDISKEFYTYIPGNFNSNLKNMDMVVCLDVLYHIVDDKDYINTLNDIFSISSEYIVLYTILEELKIPLSPHMKIRNILEDLKSFKEYSIYKIIKQEYREDSYADFIILKKKKEIIDSSNYINAFKLLEEFSMVTKDIINNYDFDNSRVLIGKIERLFENNLLIEYILESNSKQLVITGIILNEKTNEILYPNYIKDSNNLNEIRELTTNIIFNEKKYITDYIHGFIYDNSIRNNFEENKLVYSWERAMPGSQFMPFIGYLNIILRYNFVGKFIGKCDYVLEAASGFGYGAAYISTIANKVEALDLAKENIDFGEKTYNLNNINWTQGDVTQLPYLDNMFDIYISYETFEHLPLNFVDNYFKEANRVLKNGGKFIISTPNRINRKNINNPYHIKEYDIKELNEILEKYFNNIEYYSVEGLKLVNGISFDSNVMIAVIYK